MPISPEELAEAESLAESLDGTTSGELVAALCAEVLSLREELAAARFAPLGDNHHNAAACPYCSPAVMAERDAARGQIAALRAYVERLESSSVGDRPKAREYLRAEIGEVAARAFDGIETPVVCAYCRGEGFYCSACGRTGPLAGETVPEPAPEAGDYDWSGDAGR